MWLRVTSTSDSEILDHRPGLGAAKEFAAIMNHTQRDGIRRNQYCAPWTCNNTRSTVNGKSVSPVDGFSTLSVHLEQVYHEEDGIPLFKKKKREIVYLCSRG